MLERPKQQFNLDFFRNLKEDELDGYLEDDKKLKEIFIEFFDSVTEIQERLRLFKTFLENKKFRTMIIKALRGEYTLGDYFMYGSVDQERFFVLIEGLMAFKNEDISNLDIPGYKIEIEPEKDWKIDNFDEKIKTIKDFLCFGYMQLGVNNGSTFKYDFYLADTLINLGYGDDLYIARKISGYRLEYAEYDKSLKIINNVHPKWIDNHKNRCVSVRTKISPSAGDEYFYLGRESDTYNTYKNVYEEIKSDETTQTESFSSFTLTEAIDLDKQILELVESIKNPKDSNSSRIDTFNIPGYHNLTTHHTRGHISIDSRKELLEKLREFKNVRLPNLIKEIEEKEKLTKRGEALFNYTVPIKTRTTDRTAVWVIKPDGTYQLPDKIHTRKATINNSGQSDQKNPNKEEGRYEWDKIEGNCVVLSFDGRTGLEEFQSPSNFSVILRPENPTKEQIKTINDRVNYDVATSFGWSDPNDPEIRDLPEVQQERRSKNTARLNFLKEGGCGFIVNGKLKAKKERLF